MRATLTHSLLLVFLVSAGERSIAAEARQPPPNILLILADDMGYGDLGCYGATRIKTPNIDSLATEGILFTDGHCGASTCTPTRYGLLTGRHNWRTWLKYSALSTSAPLLIEENRMTVASLLKSAGYSTSIVGKWHLGFGREEGFEDDRGNAPPNYWETRGSGPNWNGELKPGPLEVGFDYSCVIPVANSFPPYVIVENHYVAGLRKDSPIGKMQSRNNGKMEGGEGARWKDEELVDKLTSKVVCQLEGFAKEKKPFFLYYAPHQPHGPWRPNPRFKGTSQAGEYGDVIQELDWSVGEALKTLDRLGLSENTLVIFSSDNGSSGRNFNGHRANGTLRGGKGDLTEGGHRVPFLARWPGRIKPSARSAETITLTDMMATFAAVIKKKLPPVAGPDSYNVLAALLGQKLPAPERPLVVSSGGTGALSIRAGKWKLLVGQGDCGYREFFSKRPHPAPKPGDPPAQLYNLEEDLGERNNLYAQHPEIVHRLKVGLEKITADENYNPTALEQPKEAISLVQLDALFARLTAARPKPKVTLTKIGGKIAAVSSFQLGKEAANMLDGDPSTFWHTCFADGDAKPPHYVVLHIPAGIRVAGLTYSAWTGGNGNGHVKEYAISVSDDGKDWGAPILSGGLKTGISDRQKISFPAPSSKPFIKFEVTAARSDRERFLAAIGELDVLVAAEAKQPLGKRRTKGKPNVLFILVDDLGWRDLGCYGHNIHETPHIDKLAADGMRFTDGYAACQVCSPTRASIMAGKYPSRTGITNWLPGDNYKGTPLRCERTAQFMKLEETTLAEALKAGGYQTAFVGKWHLGKQPYYPQHQGFDVNVAGNHWGHPHKGYFSPYQMEQLEDGPKGEYLTDRLTSEAIRVMDDFSKKEKPWLMYLSYYTVHAPFHAEAEKVKKYKEKARRANVRLNANYAAMVESLDENVGRIIRWLDLKKLRKDTIIVFTSDNGGFHKATTNRPLRGHKGSLYDGGIRVPWIVQWPGVTRPGSVCNKPVISSDFYPTLLEMTGLPLLPKQHLDGVSVAPLLKGDPDFDRGPMIWFYPHYLPRHHAEPGSAIRIGDWKFIQFYEKDRQELYNLKSDIGEADNLATRMPERAAEMKAQLDAVLKDHGAKIPAPDPAYKKK